MAMPSDDYVAGARSNAQLLDDLLFASNWYDGSESVKQDKAWDKRLGEIRSEILKRMK